MHLANGHILKTRSQHTPRHATNNTRVHCTSTRCGRYKQSSQWKPNSNWTIDELKLLLNELKRVQSSFNCSTRHFNCQTPLPPFYCFHTPSTRVKFIKVSCGAIITIPSLTACKPFHL